MRHDKGQLDNLLQTVRGIHGHGRPTSFRRGNDWYLFGGLETRTPHDQYSWDGSHRGDAEHPYLVFQYSLEGWGAYEENSQTQKVLPGMAFTALIPSLHRYYMPRESPSWTFFYVTFYHPYIVARIAEKRQQFGAVLRIDPGSRLVAKAVSLMENFYHETPGDTLAAEGALFEFLLEYERFGQNMLYAQPARERFLEDTRSLVLRHLSRTLDTQELAEAHDMTRSYFSHQFKAATGIAPAQWVQQIRLEEATRRLANTDQKLETIAREIGLGNANHLCKVFRRHFHLSPGEFRRQMK